MSAEKSDEPWKPSHLICEEPTQTIVRDTPPSLCALAISDTRPVTETIHSGRSAIFGIHTTQKREFEDMINDQGGYSIHPDRAAVVTEVSKMKRLTTQRANSSASVIAAVKVANAGAKEAVVASAQANNLDTQFDRAYRPWYLHCKIRGHMVRAVFDTGADVNVMSIAQYRELCKDVPGERIRHEQLKSPELLPLASGKTVDGAHITLKGPATMRLFRLVDGFKHGLPTQFYIMERTVWPIILGLPWINEYVKIRNFEDGSTTFVGEQATPSTDSNISALSTNSASSTSSKTSLSSSVVPSAKQSMNTARMTSSNTLTQHLQSLANVKLDSERRNVNWIIDSLTFEEVLQRVEQLEIEGDHECQSDGDDDNADQSDALVYPNHDSRSMKVTIFDEQRMVASLRRKLPLTYCKRDVESEEIDQTTMIGSETRPVNAVATCTISSSVENVVMIDHTNQESPMSTVNMQSTTQSNSVEDAHRSTSDILYGAIPSAEQEATTPSSPPPPLPMIAGLIRGVVIAPRTFKRVRIACYNTPDGEYLLDALVPDEQGRRPDLANGNNKSTSSKSRPRSTTFKQPNIVTPAQGGESFGITVRDGEAWILLPNVSTVPIEVPSQEALWQLTPFPDCVVEPHELEKELKERQHAVASLEVEDGPPEPPTSWGQAGEDEFRKVVNLSYIKELDRHEELMRVLIDNRAAFAYNAKQPEGTNIAEHAIQVDENQKAIKQQVRRESPAVMLEIQRQIDEMLKNGIISHSKSPWLSPIVMVRKSDGSLRFCIDFRKLNEATVKDSYPLPRIEELLTKLNGCSRFSKIDLAAGYWQIPMDEASAPFTAFSHGRGLYEFKRMPFGLTNAPATFQRAMEGLMHEWLDVFLLLYIDDLLIHSKSDDDHLRQIDLVLKRLAAAGLTARIDKCEWFKSEVKFLGHVVSANGLSMDPEKVSAITEMPVPTKRKELRTFLGVVGFYRRFVKQMADIAKPLYDRVKETTTRAPYIVEGSKEHESFNKLKKEIAQNVLLAFPNDRDPLWVATDASAYAIGGVISQGPTSATARPLAFASKTLDDSQRAWSTTARECWAIIWCLRHWKHYLYGQQFTVESDHAALSWLVLPRKSINDHKILRWSLELQEYMCKIAYKAGSLNRPADLMSRMENMTALEGEKHVVATLLHRIKRVGDGTEIKMTVDEVEYLLTTVPTLYAPQQQQWMVVPMSECAFGETMEVRELETPCGRREAEVVNKTRISGHWPTKTQEQSQCQLSCQVRELDDGLLKVIAVIEKQTGKSTIDWSQAGVRATDVHDPLELFLQRYARDGLVDEKKIAAVITRSKSMNYNDSGRRSTARVRQQRKRKLEHSNAELNDESSVDLKDVLINESKEVALETTNKAVPKVLLTKKQRIAKRCAEVVVEDSDDELVVDMVARGVASENGGLEKADELVNERIVISSGKQVKRKQQESVGFGLGAGEPDVERHGADERGAEMNQGRLSKELIVDGLTRQSGENPSMGSDGVSDPIVGPDDVTLIDRLNESNSANVSIECDDVAPFSDSNKRKTGRPSQRPSSEVNTGTSDQSIHLVPQVTSSISSPDGMQTDDQSTELTSCSSNQVCVNNGSSDKRLSKGARRRARVNARAKISSSTLNDQQGDTYIKSSESTSADVDGMLDSERNTLLTENDVSTMANQLEDLNVDRLRKLVLLQDKDPQLKIIHAYLTNKSLPEITEERVWLRNVLKHGRWCIDPSGLLRHAVVINKGANMLWRLVVPQSMRLEVLAHYHDAATAGHLGVSKTYKRIAERFHWPGIDADVVQYVLTCRHCNTHKVRQLSHPPLQAVDLPDAPWQMISVDLVGPLPTSRNCKHILVFSDMMTRYVEAFPVADTTSQEFLKCFYEKIICRWGAPAVLVSDNGSTFVSRLCKQMMAMFKINHRFAWPYHPQANGRVERFNATLIKCLSTLVETRQTDWAKYVAPVVHAYNTSYHPLVGATPYEANHGRNPPSLLDAMLPLTNGGDVAKNQALWQRVKETTDEIILTTRRSLESINNHRAAIIQERGAVAKFKVGDIVFRSIHVLPHVLPRFSHDQESGEKHAQRNMNETIKIAPKLAPVRTGPYVITEVMKSGIHFVLQHVNKKYEPLQNRQTAMARENELVKAPRADKAIVNNRQDRPVTVIY